jgi:predicted transcriptional regulator
MTTISVLLDDAKVVQLRETAQQLGMSEEEFVRRGVENYLERQRTIRESSERVLRENQELYRRLAQ